MEPSTDDRRFNDAFKQIAEGRRAQAVADFLEDHNGRFQHRLDLEMFRRIERKEPISYEQALAYIMQKHAHFALMNSLAQDMAKAVAAARYIEPMMSEEEQDGP